MEPRIKSAIWNIRKQKPPNQNSNKKKEYKPFPSEVWGAYTAYLGSVRHWVCPQGPLWHTDHQSSKSYCNHMVKRTSFETRQPELSPLSLGSQELWDARKIT